MLRVPPADHAKGSRRPIFYTPETFPRYLGPLRAELQYMASSHALNKLTKVVKQRKSMKISWPSASNLEFFSWFFHLWDGFALRPSRSLRSAMGPNYEANEDTKGYPAYEPHRLHRPGLTRLQMSQNQRGDPFYLYDRDHSTYTIISYAQYIMHTLHTVYRWIHALQYGIYLYVYVHYTSTLYRLLGHLSFMSR